MERKTTLSLLSALAATGTLLCGLTLLTPSHSQSIDKPDTPLKVALVLDCITQPRFQDDMGKFGMSRLLPTAGGHLLMGSLHLQTPQERNLYKSAENSNRDFAVLFVHCAHVPGKTAAARPGEPTPGKPAILRTVKASSGKEDLPSLASAESCSQVCDHLGHLYTSKPGSGVAEREKLYAEVGKAAHKAMPRLMKGQGIEQEAGDWLIVARPVRAMKPSCLQCHQGAKQGDTLGVLAYAVTKKTFADAAPAPPVRSVHGGS